MKVASVAVDGEGLCATDLRRVLADWNEIERGGKRFVFRLILRGPWIDRKVSDPTSSTPSPSARILPVV